MKRVTKTIKMVSFAIACFILQFHPVYASVSDTPLDSTDIVTNKLNGWNIFGPGMTADEMLQLIENTLGPMIVGITSVLTAAMTIVFILKSVALAKSGDNPNARQNALQGMLYSLIGTALLGGTTFFITTFTSLLK